MPGVIKIEIDGVDEFKREFSRLDATFDDLTPIWPDVRDKFWQLEREQFDSEGSAGRDGKWAALSAQYKAKKIEQYGDKPILQASGDMYGSLTGSTQYSVYETTKTEIAVGSNLPYAILHQRGGGNLPKRPPINFSDSQRDELMKTIQKSFVRELRKGKFYVSPGER
jgi:phage gpG-like protein